MNYTDSNCAVEYPERVSVQTTVTGASSHMLIHMLLKGGLERISKAKAYIHRGDPHKGVLISRAISILDSLRSSLDLEAGQEIADHLDRLYEYCQRRLLKANLDDDPAILDEVSSLLNEVKGAWDSIAPAENEVRQSSHAVVNMNRS